jgi:hypothetical protein
MTIDRYTKTMLTVIAICLLWMSLGGPSLITGVSAQPGPNDQRVVITGWTDSTGYSHALPVPKWATGAPAPGVGKSDPASLPVVTP